jgi:ubiquinone/menaquinone biosynthesis C-methylase UbiE
MEEKSGSSYVRNDHLQKSLNTKATARFAQLITEYYEKVKRPLSILDFCCGEGEPTFDLFKQLEANKVEIEKIVGYDISEETLGVAKKKNSGSPKLQFIKKNLETEFLEVEQYDAVIVLFGLHCMGNLDKAVESIYRSLKPGGLLLSLTPIEGKELY